MDTPKVDSGKNTTPTRDGMLLAMAEDSEKIGYGREIYAAYCLACHGAEDIDIDSPSNLFDGKWHHASDPAGIEKSIREGVMEKGMPAWGQMIPDQDIEAVIAYLLSFQLADIESHE